MTRDGARTLSDLQEPTLTVICVPCGRRWRYNVQRLMAQHGDAKLPDLLMALTDCHKARPARIHDRCAVRFERLKITDRAR
jgi:hypothetical protein